MRLTLPQQDVYFEQLLYPNEPIYNIGAKIAIKGSINYEVLNNAYVALIDQHDAYRTVIVSDMENTRLKVLTDHASQLEFIDFSKEEEAEPRANQYMENTFVRPFNLGSEKLLHQFTLIKVNDHFYYLFSVYHHIITDGWGTSLMFQRLVSNYNELLKDGEIKTEFPYTYKDFIIDDQHYQNSDVFISDKNYWIEKFQNLPEHLFDKIDETSDTHKSSRKELIIKRSLYNKLTDLAKEHRSSTFHIILGVLYLYFGRKHQNENFAIGLPVLNRSKSDFKKTVGLFMGVNALRMQLDIDSTFEELIGSIRQQLRQDYRHQRFPLGKLVQELDLMNNKSRLFDITLSYEKQNYSDHFHNTDTKVIPLSHKSERVALAIYIREFDEKEDVKIDFDYNLNFFDEETIDQVVKHIHTLILEVNDDPQKKLLDYEYLSKQEEKKLLHSFNRTEYSYSKEATLLSFFNDQVQNRLNQKAIKDKYSSYNYKEVDDLSNKVANYLISKFGTEEQSPVAVLMDRSADLVIVLLGILKAGRAYIPLDPSFPEDRLKYIVKHSEVNCIIGDDEQSSIIQSEVNFINIDEILQSDIKDEIFDLAKVISSKTAYIIYTSGSTGKPKGVAIGHGSLLNFLLSIQKTPGLGSQDLLFSVTTQSFDISILEFFTPLISGGTLYVVEKEMLEDPLALIKTIKVVKPTIIQATPSFYQMLFNAGWEGEKDLKVLCGGDLLSKSLAKNLLLTCSELWNMYGPTETTIWSSVKKIESPLEASNIGKPIHNTQFYILDKYKKILPIGIIGDIYIGGDGLAQEYFKNEILTDEKFTANPFNKSTKMYCTGDIGSWNKKGEIQFSGRNDNQVKIRGYRIELGEIETKLNELKAIDLSIVVSRKETNQEASLIAYVIPGKREINIEETIRFLKKELPDYMIPNAIIPVQEFPLTPNKKIDRKTLSERDIVQVSSMSNYKKPITELETELSSYYKEVLKTNRNISVEDNFFRLGGHSLNAVRLIGKINRNLGYQISLKTIFDYPSVRSLSDFLSKTELKREESIPLAKIDSNYPLILPQYAIWLASFQSEKSIAYNMFRSYKVEGNFNLDILEQAFKITLNKYEALRTNFVEFNGSPRQTIKSFQEIIFKADHFVIESSEIKKELEAYANYEFDLSNEVLLKLGLFETTTGDKILLFVTHHIIMDGWSLEVLIKEVVDSYRAQASGTKLQVRNLPIQFKDYASWQHKMELESKSSNRKFWTNYLKNYNWKSLISYDKDPLINQKYSGNFYHFDWNKMFLTELNDMALDHKITLHTLLATTFNILIYKMKNLSDICFGTINSGRPFSDLHNQIGMFVKTLPLRTSLASNDLVADIFQRVQGDMLAVDTHQDIPEDILSTLRLEAILVLQNPTFNYEKIEVDKDFVLKFQPVDAQYNRLPLLVSFSVNETNLHGSVYYDSGKYEVETIELTVQKFKKTLEQILIDPFTSIEDLDITLELEKERVIEIDFNF